MEEWVHTPYPLVIGADFPWRRCSSQYPREKSNSIPRDGVASSVLAHFHSLLSHPRLSPRSFLSWPPFPASVYQDSSSQPLVPSHRFTRSCLTSPDRFILPLYWNVLPEESHDNFVAGSKTTPASPDYPRTSRIQHTYLQVISAYLSHEGSFPCFFRGEFFVSTGQLTF